MANYGQHVSVRKTPQSEPAPGSPQVKNLAGGYSFEVDCWVRLKRFLVLGNEGGSYYATERAMTKDNASAVMDCFLQDPDRTIREIVECSVEGRAPKNSPAIFALAMLSRDKRALEAMPKVCRIGTHLFEFVEAARHFRGRGRAFNTALRNWYLDKSPDKLKYQIVKYQRRNQWSHRDVLRLCKPKTKDPDYSRALRWAVGKPIMEGPNDILAAVEEAKRATKPGQIVNLITDRGLVRECIPTEFLNNKDVWRALLDNMPMTAMIRNLGKMGSIGLLAPMSDATRIVSGRLCDPERLKGARIHPIQVLVAQGIYGQGRGLKGSLTWNPDSAVIEALNDAFYLSFDSVEPTGKRYLLGIDVSGSMGSKIAGTYLTCREAAAALAMTTIRTEPMTHAMGFCGDFVKLPLTRTTRLDDAVRHTRRLPFGRTDCALPMVYALQNKIEVDVFVVLTDSETWCGKIHPHQALVEYREKMRINAKLIVVGMVANKFSIADPSDAGMLDVVGFSTDVPVVMREFVL